MVPRSIGPVLRFLFSLLCLRSFFAYPSCGLESPSPIPFRLPESAPRRTVPRGAPLHANLHTGALLTTAGRPFISRLAYAQRCMHVRVVSEDAAGWQTASFGVIDVLLPLRSAGKMPPSARTSPKNSDFSCSIAQLHQASLKSLVAPLFRFSQQLPPVLRGCSPNREFSTLAFGLTLLSLSLSSLPLTPFHPSSRSLPLAASTLSLELAISCLPRSLLSTLATPPSTR